MYRHARVQVKGPAQLLPSVCMCMWRQWEPTCEYAQTSVSGHDAISGALAQLILGFIGGSYFSFECHCHEYGEQIMNVYIEMWRKWVTCNWVLCLLPLPTTWFRTWVWNYKRFSHMSFVRYGLGLSCWMILQVIVPSLGVSDIGKNPSVCPKKKKRKQCIDYKLITLLL